MRIRNVKAAIIGGLLAAAVGENVAAERNIWVAVTEPSSEYQVKIPIGTFLAITGGKYKKPFVHFTNVYWLNRDEKTMQPQAQAGKVWGYSSEVYVRVSEILRIVPLTDDHIERYGLNAERYPNDK